MSEPISAQDAKQRSNNRSKIIAEEELQPVYPLIENACTIGVYEIYYKGELSTHAINRLEELGYRVEITESMGGSVHISWA